MKAIRNVFLIGDTKSFMVNAVAKGLNEEGFDVLQALPSVNEIDHIKEYPAIWIMYLDDKLKSQKDMLVYVKDKIIENKSYFFLIGNPTEISDAEEFLPKELIRKVFVRPLNMASFAAALEDAYAEETKAEEKKKILIIDDNPTTLHNLQAQLETKYRVFIVSSGINGISFLVKQPVDLILLDYEMPVADGPQVMEMMKQDVTLSSIPIMFLTGKSDKESVVKAVALKPVKYLLKTMPPEDLIREIDDFFRERRWSV
ncbi:MAG: response regulator [Lachnospiraceae bacterium]|nr:response regulator [Lachnospiraceae bacterium]